MIKSFEEFQTLGKDSLAAYVASTGALTKGFQSLAQEAVEFTAKSFEKSTAAVEKAVAATSFDKAIEAQQTYAKEAYDDFVGQVGKFGELYVATAKEAYKHFEPSLSAFGFKAPK